MKKLILFYLFFAFNFILLAQDNIFNKDNQLTYKEVESYKSINFKVWNIESQEQIDKFIQLLKNNSDVFCAYYNQSNKECNIDTRLNLAQMDIVILTGTNGYKISDYKEKVNLHVSKSTAPQQERKQHNNSSDNQGLTKVIFSIQNINEENKERFITDINQINGVNKFEISPSNDKVLFELQNNLNIVQLQLLLTQKGYLVNNVSEKSRPSSEIVNSTPPIESTSTKKEKKELTPNEMIEHLEQLVKKRKAEGSDYHKYEIEIERLKKEISKKTNKNKNEDKYIHN
ncbi:MAG: hypothetical protein A2046_12510 [Bacteroidetes bacterium GWA2_30_7]|nr:MAG: hypothetical protein A2046_12510 [Bacteroidetes bacterium GWA2_30_7]